jgi:hypothetical protein
MECYVGFWNRSQQFDLWQVNEAESSDNKVCVPSEPVSHSFVKFFHAVRPGKLIIDVRKTEFEPSWLNDDIKLPEQTGSR